MAQKQPGYHKYRAMLYTDRDELRGVRAISKYHKHFRIGRWVLRVSDYCGGYRAVVHLAQGNKVAAVGTSIRTTVQRAVCYVYFNTQLEMDDEAAYAASHYVSFRFDKGHDVVCYALLDWTRQYQRYHPKHRLGTD